MLCVMFDLHIPKIIAYLIERGELFLYPSSFPTQFIDQFLKELLWKYFLARLIRFLCLQVIFC